MKKSLLAMATLAAFAGGAYAQSSVTLFGIIDLNARYQDNGSAGKTKTLSTDGNASSRFGVRGVEDLGGGLRGGFWLEGGMTPDDGTPTGQTWRRRSTVSLLGGFGEIRLGRDYTPTFWNHTIFDPFGTNGVGSQTNLMTQAAANGTQAASRVLNVPGSGTGTLVRADNTIGYFLPSMGGVYGQLMVAAGEGTTGNKYFGGRIGYGAGPVNVAFAYGKTDKTGTMADDLTGWNVGGSWNFGVATLVGQYHVYSYNNLDQKNIVIGALVPMGAGTIKASYGKADVDLTTTTSRTATMWALGYVHDLSKRTAIYTHYSRINNDPGLSFTVGQSVGAATAGQNSTGWEVGVRHSF